MSFVSFDENTLGNDLVFFGIRCFVFITVGQWIGYEWVNYVPENGLSKLAMATKVEGSISTSDLPSYVIDSLFDSFGEETKPGDDYVRNYDEFG